MAMRAGVVAVALVALGGPGCSESEGEWDPNTNTGDGQLRLWTQSTRDKVQPTTEPTGADAVVLAAL